MTDQPLKPKVDPSTKRILVVDDDDAVRLMLEATLTAEGFVVKAARDARNVLKIALEFKPNLVLSDMMMPGASGYELFQTLQSDPSTRQIPVILMSGHSFNDSAKTLFKQEPNVIDFCEKPLRPHQFLSKIHKTLNTKSRDEIQAEQRSKFDQIKSDRFEDLR